MGTFDYYLERSISYINVRYHEHVHACENSYYGTDQSYQSPKAGTEQTLDLDDLPCFVCMPCMWYRCAKKVKDELVCIAIGWNCLLSDRVYMCQGDDGSGDDDDEEKKHHRYKHHHHRKSHDDE